jgi:acyl-CoA dehydrogenase
MTIATEPTTPSSPLSLPLELEPQQAELRDRARRFIDEVVIPLEQKAEQNGGRLPAEDVERVKQAGIEARLNGGLHSPDYGGQGWTRLEWALVEEQFGRSTNGIYWHIPNAYNVWDHASPEQCERYLRPALRGELKDSYAVTERDAGSDPSRIEATAERTDGGYRINGEKWFVTSGDVASVHIVMANVIDGGERLPTLFLVDDDLDGIEVVADPQFTHSYPEGHPTIRFTDVDVPEDAVVGGIGEGDEMQRGWFTEERIAIAARGVGAMWRLLDETVAWATGREQGGSRIYDYQGVSFPLADSAADAAAGRLLALSVATMVDAGADRKLVHHERLLREIRVDRIWEGTSEIQRLIVARGLERRGVDRILH